MDVIAILIIEWELAMNKKWIKPIVLLLVFIAAIIVFEIITNKTQKDLTTSMPEATLPVIYFKQGEKKINELHGYTNKMDATKMRDTITAIEDNRNLTLLIDTYGSEVDGISYEIRDMKGQGLVADGEITEYQSTNQQIIANIQVQNLLTEDKEYLMNIALTTQEETIYYYTRIMQTTSCYVNECLEFAFQFHDYTFRDDAEDFIPTYMEATTGNTATLQYVDLNCSLNQITWGDLAGQVLTQPIASFKEINSSYNVLTLKYILTAQNESGETEYYNIEEYYRLRQTSTRMYVLNFERTMEQIFQEDNTFLTDAKNIMLGIRNTDVEYAVDEAGTVICFAQAGELWRFDLNTNELVEIFSFHSDEWHDARQNWDQHAIDIVKVDEAGSVDFIVYGYMNRGVHEGKVGIAVYHYDALAHTVEEAVFIPVNQSYEMLKAELGQLIYENDKQILYLMMMGDVYQIDMSSLTVKKLINGLEDGCYSASESCRYFAWVNANSRYSSTMISLMDLKDGTIHEIKENEGNYLMPLGFSGEDFIYGIADSQSVWIDAAGNTMFPMKSLKIAHITDGKYEVIKEYTPGNGSIGGISIDDYSIKVALMQMENGQFYYSGTDSIINQNADEEENVAISTIESVPKKTLVQLKLKKLPKDGKIKQISATNIIVEENREVELNISAEIERFYVYVKGEVLLATDSISDAILLANEKMGVVIDSKQQYVWMRGVKKSQTAFTNIGPNESDIGANSIVCCISAMLNRKDVGISVRELVENGQTPKSVLTSALKDSVVLDLTGCTVEEIVFYVSQGNPVFAMTGNNSAVLIVGYTQDRISFYDPQTGGVRSMSRNEANNWFSAAGNIFFSYL